MLGKVVELSEVCLRSVDTCRYQTGLTIGAGLGAPDSNEENQYSALRRLKIFLRARRKKKKKKFLVGSAPPLAGVHVTHTRVQRHAAGVAGACQWGIEPMGSSVRAEGARAGLRVIA